MAEAKAIFVSGAGTSKREALYIGGALAEVYNCENVEVWTLAQAVENRARLIASSENQLVVGHSTGVEIISHLPAKRRIGIDGAVGSSLMSMALHTPAVLFDALRDVQTTSSPRQALSIAARSLAEVVIHCKQHKSAVLELPNFDVAQHAFAHASYGLPYTAAVHEGDKYFPPDLRSLERARKVGAVVCVLPGSHTEILVRPLQIFAAIKDEEDASAKALNSTLSMQDSM